MPGRRLCRGDFFALFENFVRGPGTGLVLEGLPLPCGAQLDHRSVPPPAIALAEELFAEEGAKPEDQVDTRLEQRAVRNAPRLLTPGQRQVVVLRFLGGWENDEVSEALHKPLGAVKALQHRALVVLRKYLLGNTQEEGMYADQ